MKRFLLKISRFFWSWGFLKFVLWTITLIVLLYVEEDWRGARAWAATKEKWEAKGESFDMNQLIPPPIPDGQNLAAISLFKMEPFTKGSSYLEPTILRKALRSGIQGNLLPSPGRWEPGQLPDLEKLRSAIATNYAAAFQGVPPPQSTLAQLDALYPFIAELHAASVERPFCRFAQDYDPQPPYGPLLTLITSQIQVAKMLRIHALLALSEKQPTVALDDIKIIVKIDTGLAHEPILVSGLVASALTAIAAVAINDGLVAHSWNDAQLAEIQATLATLDPLADFQLSLRGEFIGFSLPTIEYLKGHRPRIKNFFKIKDESPPSYATDPAFLAWPGGWLDLNGALIADAFLGGVSFVDPKAHRVFPDLANQEEKEVQSFVSHWTAYAPWSILYAITTGPILNTTVQFARAQVWLDEARIACALERYRLAHGAYPDKLDALVPAGIDVVPIDPMNGQPYHYYLRPDGTFLLYSIGWNLKDDGGVSVSSLIAPVAPNDTPQRHGDWVWPAPQSAP